MSRTLSYLTRVSAVLATLGCHDATAPIAPQGCVGPVKIAVLTEPTPVFGWSPACGVSMVWVVTVPSSPGESEESRWAFSVPENTPVGPGLRYGVTPAGATTWTPAHVLVPGTAYRVRVMQTLGGDVVVAGGEKIFTY